MNSSTHWPKLRINITYSSGDIKLLKFQWHHLCIPEVLLKKLLQHDTCRIYSSIHWRKLRINIVNNSGEIKLWKFQWRHSRIPEVLSKSFWSLIDAEFSPLFTCAKSALILLIVAEKSNFEIFNDVIRAYRKYFRKSCLQTKCVEFDSVLPATNCSSISLTVLRLFTFKRIYEVIFVNRK